MTTLLQPQKLPPANDGHVRDNLTADERLLKQAVARCLKAQVAGVHGRLVGGTVSKGGPGSGNFGHEGRPGEVGGSGSGGGSGEESASKTEIIRENKPGLYGSRYINAVVDGHPWKIRIADHEAGLSSAVPLPEVSRTYREELMEAATIKNDNPFTMNWITEDPSAVNFSDIVGIIRQNVLEEFFTHEDARYGGSVSIEGSPSNPSVEVEGDYVKEKSLKSYSPISAVPSNTKPWDDMVMREVRPIWFGLFKKGGDKALQNIRRFPKHARKMAVLSWAEMEASERVKVVQKGGPGSGNFGHEGRPGLVGGSGEGEKIQTNLPTFQKWFSDSKVVDTQGAPLVVYHGTEKEFTSFHISGLGAHFGTEEQAWERLRQAGSSDESKYKVDAYFLAIKNPVRLEDTGDWLPTTTYANLERVGALPDSLESDEAQQLQDRILNSKDELGAIREELLRRGYDGVVYENKKEGPGLSWIVFHPTQVKSADNNSGIFDPDNPDITKSLKATPSIVIPEWIEDPDVLTALENEMFKFTHGINQTTADDLRAELIAGMENGETIGQLADRISGLSDEWVEGWRSEMIARTETARAFSTGHIEAWRSTGVVNRKVWVAAGDACPFCQQMDGTVVDLDENFFDQGDEQTTDWRGQEVVMGHDYSDVNGPPLHPNCFVFGRVKIMTEHGEKRISKIHVGDRVLTARGRFRPVTSVLNNRRKYIGPVVKIQFRGRLQHFDARTVVTVTPEHPFLTDGGWKAAQDVTPNDSLYVLASYCLACGKKIPFWRKYCSDECIYVDQPEIGEKISEIKKQRNWMKGRTGALHHSWRGGKIWWRGKDWDVLKRKIVERDGFMCQDCGMTEEACLEKSGQPLHVHHLNPYRDSFDNSPQNLITLCVSCHAKREGTVNSRFLKRGGVSFIDTPVLAVQHIDNFKGERLYNFSVAEDESYVAQGIVNHNCRCVLVAELKDETEQETNNE